MQGDSKKAVLLLTSIKKIQDKENLRLSSAGVERMNNYLIWLRAGKIKHFGCIKTVLYSLKLKLDIFITTQ